MKSPLVFFGVRAVGEAVANGHVCLAAKDGFDHGLGLGFVVGVVAIDHEVAVGLDVAEHLPAYVTLALAGLEPDDGAMLSSNLGGIIAGVIVINVDGCSGKLPDVIVDDLTDGQRLVVTRDDDGNVLIIILQCRLPWPLCWYELVYAGMN